MTAPEPSPRVRPAVATALSVIGFFAVLIAGLGLASLATDTDVIPVPGLGQVPGAVGVGIATLVFAATLWGAVRRPHPSFWSVVVLAAATFLAYLLSTGVAAAVVRGDIATGVAVAGSLAVGWPGLIVAASAAVAGWAGIALVRTRAARPRWPWEGDE
jgi:hypothetical protein